MSIKKIMSTDLVYIDVDESISTVKQIFECVSFHHILVLENEKLVGVISDRDYFKSVGPRVGTVIATERDKMPLNKKAHQIMNRRLVTVTEKNSISDVVNCFHQKRVSCVPVIDAYGCPIGIISWRDIIDVLAAKMNKKRITNQTK